MTLTFVILLFVIGWVAAAAIGTQAYFLGEQSKPIHERNWRSRSFEKLATSVTGREINYDRRVPGFETDAYGSSLLPDA
jgi:hypothetical protein